MMAEAKADGGPAGRTRVEEAAPLARFSLRVRGEDREALGEALGLSMPVHIGERSEANGREVLCLGPDEWLLTAADAERDRIVEASQAAYDRVPHALADISDREIRYVIDGPDALALLSMGCPRDLSRLKVGHGTRTVFDGATVVLWRDGPARFRMDVWRSFAAHARALIDIGMAELGTGL